MAVTKIPISPSEDGDNTPQQQQPVAPGAPSHSLHQHTISNASTATVDIEAWTVSALESLNIAPIARGTGNSLSIPLDSHDSAPLRADEVGAARMKLRNAVVFDNNDVYGANITPPRRPLSRRDSMKKRDELQRGKEGSRQRRRWENDHLLHIPNVQPPLPTDWEIHPTHPVHATVPYQLAQYWDKGLRERVEERKAAFAVHRKKIVTVPSSHHHQHDDEHVPTTSTVAVVSIAVSGSSAHARADVGKVPKDLRATVKRTPAVKSWLRVLEEPVRAFMVERGFLATQDGEEKHSSDEMDSEDEEIVFVGRNGGMRDGKKGWKKARREGQEQRAETGMVLDSLGDDETGAFKRWLTHSISDYYGLDSRSVTVGNPARRVVFVGVKQVAQRHGKHAPSPAVVRSVLPPPLWEMF